MIYLLDLVVAVLLLTTIFYTWRLGRSIKQLKQSKGEMIDFIKDFSESVARAELSIIQMRKMNGEIGVELKSNIEKARFLANDLSFLIQKGNEVGDNIEYRINATKEVRYQVPLAPQENSQKHTKDFASRAEKISSGQVVKAFDNVETVKLESEKIASKRKALESAMEQIARKNAELRNAENKAEIKPSMVQQPEMKQRRLFDALRWTRQLQ